MGLKLFTMPPWPTVKTVDHFHIVPLGQNWEMSLKLTLMGQRPRLAVERTLSPEGACYSLK